MTTLVYLSDEGGNSHDILRGSPNTRLILILTVMSVTVKYAPGSANASVPWMGGNSASDVR